MAMRILKNKIFIGIVVCLVFAGGIFALHENTKINLAHSTFENYYAFRGCTQLIDRTDTYGDCKLSNGQTIKIVLYKGAWYLDGDLPMWGSFGF
jgi:hypothetical protein